MILPKNRLSQHLSQSYNRLIEVWKNAEAKNELGEVIQELRLKKVIHGDIVPQTGKMVTLPAGTLLSDVSVKIRMPYINGRDITEDMVLKYKGREMEIKYILDPFENHETLEIYCSERK